MTYAPPPTDQSQDFRTYRLGPHEAIEALGDLAREAAAACDTELGRVFLVLGRRLSDPGAIDALIASREAEADGEELSVALQFRSEDVVAPIVRRLVDAGSLTARRVHFALLLILGSFHELRDALAVQLVQLLDAPHWYAVRNAIVLLSAIGTGVPRRSWKRLAASPHRQVRLALAQEVARWTPDPQALEILLPLLDDSDAGVRFTAAVALGAFPSARVKQALLRRHRHESDAEVRTACAAALRRKTLATAVA